MTTHEELGEFMAGFQSDPRTQMAYVGNDPAEIATSLREFATTVEDRFLVERDKHGIVAVLGVDRDEELGRSWLYGPFVRSGVTSPIEDDLWARLLPLLPEAITEIDCGFNAANERALDFANRYGFERFSEGYFMFCERSTFAPPEATIETGLLHPSEEERFVAIYDETFPHGDYSGRQLLDRRNEHRQIFGARHRGELIGYLYGEARPDFDESGIDYVGVTQESRGMGAGTALIATAAEWIFSFGISKIELYARMDNPALHLYEKLGWVRQAHILGYRKQLR